jgi:hypothetical protein
MRQVIIIYQTKPNHESKKSHCIISFFNVIDNDWAK